MIESPRFLSFDQFMAANTIGVISEDNRMLIIFTRMALKLQEEGKLKLNNFLTLTPFVAMGGNVENFLNYFETQHRDNPENWDNWSQIKAELESVFEEHFKKNR